jgi:hypothetical protein
MTSKLKIKHKISIAMSKHIIDNLFSMLRGNPVYALEIISNNLPLLLQEVKSTPIVGSLYCDLNSDCSYIQMLHTSLIEILIEEFTKLGSSELIKKVIDTVHETCSPPSGKPLADMWILTNLFSSLRDGEDVVFEVLFKHICVDKDSLKQCILEFLSFRSHRTDNNYFRLVNRFIGKMGTEDYFDLLISVIDKFKKNGLSFYNDYPFILALSKLYEKCSVDERHLILDKVTKLKHPNYSTQLVNLFSTIDNDLCSSSGVEELS